MRFIVEMGKKMDRPGGSEKLSWSLQNQGEGKCMYPVDIKKCLWIMDDAGPATKSGNFQKPLPPFLDEKRKYK